MNNPYIPVFLEWLASPEGVNPTELDLRNHVCGGCRMVTHGDLYVCTESGNFHHCGKKCNAKLRGGESKDCDVCPITGRTFELDFETADLIWTGHYDLKRGAEEAQGKPPPPLTNSRKRKPDAIEAITGTSDAGADADATGEWADASREIEADDDGTIRSTGGVGMSSLELAEAKHQKRIGLLRNSAMGQLRLMMCSNERNEIERKKHELYLSKTADRIMKYHAKCTRERRAVKMFEVIDMMNEARVHQEEHHLFPVEPTPKMTEIIEDLADRIVHYWLTFTEEFKEEVAAKHYRFEHHVIAYTYARATGVSRLVPEDEDLKAYLPNKGDAHLYQPNRSSPIRREHISRGSSTLNQLMTRYKSLFVS